MPDNQNTEEAPKPLGLKCTDTDCENGLHCFRQTRNMRKNDIRGSCRTCGADLVNWERIRRHDVGDVEYTISALQFELIRHHFWHLPIDVKAVNHARRKGRSGITVAAVQRIRNSVASPNHPREGRQTPFSGNNVVLRPARCSSVLQGMYRRVARHSSPSRPDGSRGAIPGRFGHVVRRPTAAQPDRGR